MRLAYTACPTALAAAARGAERSGGAFTVLPPADEAIANEANSANAVDVQETPAASDDAACEAPVSDDGEAFQSPGGANGDATEWAVALRDWLDGQDLREAAASKAAFKFARDSADLLRDCERHPWFRIVKYRGGHRLGLSEAGVATLEED